MDLLNAVAENFDARRDVSIMLRSCDASLSIENEKAAQFFETIVLHDWTRIARQSVA